MLHGYPNPTGVRLNPKKTFLGKYLVSSCRARGTAHTHCQYFFDSGLPCIGRPILLSHYSSKHFGKLNCVSNNEHVIPGCKYCDHKMEEESQLSWRLGGLADLFWAHWNVCLIIVYCTYRSWSCLRNRKTPSGKDVIWLSWRYL
jgi:hypothetical protein